MARWAPYRTCPTCGSGYFAPQEEDGAYWGPGAEPSPEQLAFWGGRAGQWRVALGDGVPGRVLDIGCGFGHFVAWAAGQGWDAWGVDTDPWAIERTVAPGRVVTELDDFRGRFDLITLWDVLEHFPDPVETAGTFGGRLVDNGRIFVCSPNFDGLKLRWALYRRRPELFTATIKPHEHKVQFTRDGLRLTLERAGYTDVQFHNPPLATRSGWLSNAAARRWPVIRMGLFASARALG